MTTVQSIEAWRSLPELPMGRITKPQETGIIYSVIAVGMVVASVSDCQKQGLREALPMVGDMTVLPTATIRTDAGATVYRLPLTLAPWVAHTCAFAEQGTKLLPGDVEFSDLNGRITADLH
jgi:hypothetical protein